MSGALGSGGHNRLPDNVKAMHGTLRPCRVNPDEPSVEPVGADALPPPSWLKKDGKAYWLRITAAMATMRYLAEADVADIEQAAFWYQRFHELRRELPKSDDQTGTSIRLESAASHLRAATAKLGLNPVDRSRVKAKGEKAPVDSKARLLGAR